MATYSNLKVISLDRSVPNNVVIEFELPESLKTQFQFHPGQFVVVKYLLAGLEYKRSYSLSHSAVHNVLLQITVKRVGDGITSNFANNDLKVNDYLEVGAPRGKFCIELNSAAQNTYYLIAAGSGIAPMHSMLQSVLQFEPNSKICLLYGNTNDDSIIFGKEILAFAMQYPERIKVQHVLSRQSKALNLLQHQEIWEGRIGENILRRFFDAHPVPNAFKIFVCGPSEMNVACKEILTRLGFPKEKVHIEFFGKI